MKTCKNCGGSFEHDYCNHCGQKYIDQRFTLKESIGWVFSSIFNFEKGFMYTSKILFVNPKELIGGYLNGITVRYFHPFRFLFVWATIAAIVAIFTHAYEEIGQLSAEMNSNGEAFKEEFGKSYGEFLKKYMSIMTLVLIPFLSLFTRLFYRKRKLYFTEHLILNSYSLAGSTIIGILPTLLYFVLSHEQIGFMMYVSSGIGLLVPSYINSRFFNENIFLSILKYTIAYLLTIFLLMISIVIVMIIHLLLIKFAGFEDVYSPIFEAARASKELQAN